MRWEDVGYTPSWGENQRKQEEKDDDIHIVLALYAEIDYASDAAKIYKAIEICEYRKSIEDSEVTMMEE